MSTALHLLILEDDSLDAELEIATLEEAGYTCQWERVETQAEFLARLDTPDYDIILADYNLPTFDGLTALHLYLERALDLPFIFVSGTMGEETAIESLKAGATDYVLKEHLSRLGPVVKRALHEREDHRKRRRVEEELQKSQLLLTAIIDHSPAAIQVKDLQGRYLLVNNQIETIFNFQQGEAIGKTPHDIFPQEIAKKFLADDQTALRSRTAVQTEETIPFPDGMHTFIALKFPLVDASGEPYAVAGISTDITEQKRAEEALRDSRRRLRAIFDQTFEFMGVMAPDGILTEVNQTALDFAGLEESDVIGKPFWETPWWTHSPELQEQLREAVAKAASGEFVRFEANHLAADGSLHYADFSLKPVRDEAGNVSFLIPEGRDITERVHSEQKRAQAEEALGAERDFSASLLDALLDTVFVFDPETGKALRWNKAFNEISGYTDEEISSKKAPDDWYSAQDLEKTAEELAKLSRGKKSVIEMTLITKDGRRIPTEYSAAMVQGPKSDSQHIIAVGRDITERKQAEEMLQESEERYRIVSELTSDIAYAVRVEPDGTTVPEWVAGPLVRITGFTVSELVARGGWPSLLHPDDLPLAFKHLQVHLAGEPDVAEYRIVTKSGNVRWLRDYGYPLWDETQARVVRIIGAAQDITEQKQAEEALRESEERLRSLSAVASEGIMIHEGGIILDANQAFADLSGYPNPDDLIGKNGMEMIPFTPESKQRVLSHMRAGSTEAYDIELTKPDGSTIPAETRGKEITYRGRKARLVSMRDITARKRIEEALRYRIEFEGLITDISTHFINLPSEEIEDGINRALQLIGGVAGVDRSYVFLFREDGATMDNTHEWCAEGIRPQIQELKGIPTNIFPWSLERIRRSEIVYIPRVADLPPEASAEKKEFLAEGIQSLILVPIVHTGVALGFLGLDSVRAERAWTEDIIALLRIVGEIFANALERKRAAKALATSEATLRSIFQVAPVGIGLVKDRVFQWTNDRLRQMLGYTEEELKGQSARMVYPSQEEYERVGQVKYEEIAEQGTGSVETRWQHKDGRIIDIILSSTPLDPTDLSKGVTFTALDITKRKQAEAKIERALRETHVRLGISQALATAQTEDEVLDALIGQMSIYPNTHPAIFTVAPETEELTVALRRQTNYECTLAPFPEDLRTTASETPMLKDTAEGKPFITSNLLEDDPDVREAARNTGVRSVIAQPLMVGGQFLGDILVNSPEVGYFDEEKLHLYQTLAEQGASALQIARLNDSVQNSLRETQVRFDVSQALATAQTEDEVLDALIGQMSIYPNTQAGVLTVVPGAEEPTVVVCRQANYECTLPPIEEGMQFPVSQFPTDIPQMEGRPFISSDLREDESAGPAASEMARQLGIRGALTLPLMAGDQLMAVIAASSPEVGYFDEQKLHLYQTLAEQGAVALRAARLRETIRESQQRLSLLVQQSPLAIIEWDTNFQVAAWNPTAERIFGYTYEEALGRHAAGFLVPKDAQPLINQIWQNLLAQQGSTHSINDNVTKDGRRITCEWFSAPLLDADGQIIGVVSLVEDITERKQTEEEREHLLDQVQEQAQRVQQIIETVPEGVILLDAKNRVIMANPLGRRDLAVLADTLTGGTLTRLGEHPLPEFLTSPPQGLWHEVSAEGQTFQVIARPIETGPTPGGWVLVVRDITQQREIERRVHQQERLAAVGQLAAGIAHDFNNIMAVISLYAGMSLRTTDLPEKIYERLETIDQQAHRASDLIQQILDFSRRAVLERLPMELGMFLKEQVKLLRRTLPENIKIDLMVGSDEYTVNADLTRVQQMIMNLATNARDSMPEGGQLHIGLEKVWIAGPQDAPLPDMQPGEWVRITVVDTGCGIPTDVLPHIYDPFFTTKPVGMGTGLGLSQVYGIVKQHEGCIDVKSQEEEGTTFTIYLPSLAQLQPEPVSRETEALVQGQGQLILVVEDDAATRAALVDGLELLNYRVIEATNGREALSVFEQHAEHADAAEQISLVLSDMVMPEMGGRALLHALQERALQKRSETAKIVLLTGHPLDEETFEDLKPHGLQDWLLKPLSIERLSQAVAQALEGKDSEE